MGDFWNIFALPGIVMVGKIIAILVPLLIAVAYLTFAERKVIAAMQLRKGPNVVGPFGLLQSLADAHADSSHPPGSYYCLSDS